MFGSNKIKKGTVVSFELGYGSDRKSRLLVKAKRNVDLDELKDLYFYIYPERKGEYRLRVSEFVDWCIKKAEVFTPFSYVSAHCGISEIEFLVTEIKENP